MTISENAVREAVGRAVAALERVAATEYPEFFTSGYMKGYDEGSAIAYRHALAMTREELADYLPIPTPCGCGNPADGVDGNGAPICGHCAATTAQALEELSSGGTL